MPGPELLLASADAWSNQLAVTSGPARALLSDVGRRIVTFQRRLL
jgi:hypothetical protein